MGVLTENRWRMQDGIISVWDGTSWLIHSQMNFNTSFVPVLGQGAATPNIAKSVVKSEWRYDGPMIEFECRLDPTGTGTAGEFLSATLPVPPITSFYSNGSHFIYHGGFYYLGSMESFAGNTAVVFNVGGSSVWGFGPSVAVGPGDQVRFSIRYRWR